MSQIGTFNRMTNVTSHSEDGCQIVPQLIKISKNEVVYGNRYLIRYTGPSIIYSISCCADLSHFPNTYRQIIFDIRKKKLCRHETEYKKQVF